MKSIRVLGNTRPGSRADNSDGIMADRMKAGRASARFVLLFLTLVSTASVDAQVRYSFPNDGSEVADSMSGLIWRRCTEGQKWNGQGCAGLPMAFTYDEALAHARTQSGWRLPDVKELAGIVDRGRSNPAIDVIAFPGTQSNWYWSSSPFAGSAGSAWFVFFSNGLVHYGSRKGSYAIRLVKS